MAAQLTLIADLSRVTSRRSQLSHGFKLGVAHPDQIEALGALYFAAYPPGEACAALEEAIEDTTASFEGEYGELWPEASPIVLFDGEIVAALFTVKRAPWEDTPDCPFIIELFTSRAHRRKRLARYLVQECASVLLDAGEQQIALRVIDANAAAVSLYTSLGFHINNASQ